MGISKRITPYVRVIGMNERGKALISKITKENPKLEIITSVKKFKETNKNKLLNEMLETDIKATDVYSLEYQKDSVAGMDYITKIVTI